MINNFLIYTPSVSELNTNQKLGSCYFVDKSQPLQVHKAVEQLSIYFKREGKFDFAQYTALEDRESKNAHAYIWVEETWDDLVAVGACGFRYLGDIGQIKDWSMQWAWIHPYRRCMGLLTQAWPHFVKKYGKDYHCEPPLSHEMKMFLNKMNHKF